MKSKKVIELIEWLNSSTNIIDMPRSFSDDDVVKLVEISELELTNQYDLLLEKVNEFKKIYFYEKPIKSRK